MFFKYLRLFARKFFYVSILTNMTEVSLLNRKFVSAMQERIAHRATLVQTIAELLDVDRDAVYRRLRGDVGFSFAEMAIIARRLGISLDDIAGIDTAQCNIRLAFMKHIDPSEVDYAISEEYINALKFIKDEPETKIMEGGNLFPNYLFFDYEYITRVIMFRWSQSSYFGKRLPFHEVIIPERMRNLQKQVCLYARHVKSTTYVWDIMVFEYFTSSVKFYAQQRLIEKEDVALIKKDLNLFLNDLEKLAVTGKHKETGNEVSIYVGELNAYSNFGYIEAKNLRISLFRAFLLNSFSSLEGLLFDEISSWLHSAQRMTTLISVSGEKIRSEFFEAQREIVNTL